MPARSAELRSRTAHAGAATRWNKPDAADQRRDLAEARLAEVIRRTVAAAPPLRPDQRDRLALLLRGDAA